MKQLMFIREYADCNSCGNPIRNRDSWERCQGWLNGIASSILRRCVQKRLQSAGRTYVLHQHKAAIRD
jgi:hypothetical protein